MPIRLLLEHDHSFGPKDIPKLILAFEAVLKELNLNNREEPATMLVAKAIVLAACSPRARCRAVRILFPGRKVDDVTYRCEGCEAEVMKPSHGRGDAQSNNGKPSEGTAAPVHLNRSPPKKIFLSC